VAVSASNGKDDLPHAVEAEQGLLGSMLVQPLRAIPKVMEQIGWDYFYVSAHQTVYGVLLDLWKSQDGAGIDLITLTQALIDRGMLDAVGGASFVTSLFTFVPTASNVGYYIEIVREKYLRRRLIAAAQETLRSAREENDDVVGVIERVRSSSEVISGLMGANGAASLTFRTLTELMALNFNDDDNFFGDRILAAGQPCTLIGPGGVGKSRLSMQLAICMITGRPFLDMPTRGRGHRWLFMQSENNNRRLHWDLKRICEALNLSGLELAEVDQRLFIHTLENDLDSFLNLMDPRSNAAIDKAIQDKKPSFVVWDPLNTLTNGDLNADLDMRAVITAISQVTRKGDLNRVPVVLHHSLTGKAGAAKAVGWDKASYGRNSKTLHSWTRAQINLTPRTADDPNLLVVACGKNNNGRAFPEIGVCFDDDAGIYRIDNSYDPEEFREETGSASSAKRGDPKMLTELMEKGQEYERKDIVKLITDQTGLGKTRAYEIIEKAEKMKIVTTHKGTKCLQLG
jgi:hypothetical protein